MVNIPGTTAQLHANKFTVVFAEIFKGVRIIRITTRIEYTLSPRGLRHRHI